MSFTKCSHVPGLILVICRKFHKCRVFIYCIGRKFCRVKFFVDLFLSVKILIRDNINHWYATWNLRKYNAVNLVKWVSAKIFIPRNFLAIRYVLNVYTSSISLCRFGEARRYNSGGHSWQHWYWSGTPLQLSRIQVCHLHAQHTVTGKSCSFVPSLHPAFRHLETTKS